ncbi:MAG: S-adenosylmethionine:tRNA ribosyltransferase-isomerase [Bacillota bacterium]
MAAFTFALPPELSAAAPPERRGLRRDHVRLLVLDRATGEATHSRFDRLGDFLRPGDLLVLNNSRTLPAVLPARAPDGQPVEIRLAHRLGEDRWRALLVGGPAVRPGLRLLLPEGLEAEVSEHREGEPLSVIRFSRSGTALYDTLYRIGQPVRYEYIREPWGLDYYQTVFAAAPGSVEMPSAGRAFTWELLLRLRRQGIGIAFLSLHAGLSYLLDDRWVKDPRYTPEAYTIPAETAAAVDRAKRSGGRVVAVGTTVVRALESEALTGQRSGWASLFIHREFPLRVVDGLITGLHEPEATHLDLLSALMEPERLREAYQEAIARGYLWHEFGDANLIL